MFRLLAEAIFAVARMSGGTAVASIVFALLEVQIVLTFAVTFAPIAWTRASLLSRLVTNAIVALPITKPALLFLTTVSVIVVALFNVVL